MAFVAVSLSVLIAALGAVGIAYPEVIVGFTRILQAPNALYVAAGGRIVFGVAVFFAAPASLAPTRSALASYRPRGPGGLGPP